MTIWILVMAWNLKTTHSHISIGFKTEADCRFALARLSASDDITRDMVFKCEEKKR